MFEAELELENHSTVVPLILTLTLLLVVVGAVGGIGYLVYESNRAVTPAQVMPAVTAALKAQAPAAVHFYSGDVKPSVAERPGDPHYRLLEKAGVVKLRADKKTGGVFVTVTPDGERLLAELPGVQKSKKADTTTLYAAPLAERQLVEIVRVSRTGTNAATVEYTWKWAPTKLGDVFDASGASLKSFNTWDRALLIQKYGADFYHGDAKKEILSLVRKDGNWVIAPE